MKLTGMKKIEKSIYSERLLITNVWHFMKQNADIQQGISQVKSTGKPLPTPKFLITNESFQTRYFIKISLKGHKNCQGLKLKDPKNLLFIK